MEDVSRYRVTLTHLSLAAVVYAAVVRAAVVSPAVVHAAVVSPAAVHAVAILASVSSKQAKEGKGNESVPAQKSRLLNRLFFRLLKNKLVNYKVVN